VTIVPEYRHSGDVTPGTGPLTYDGDLVITGNVTGKTLIVATGQILVAGSVVNAEIVAGEQIWLLDEIRYTTVSSGYTAHPDRTVCHQLQHLSEVLAILEHGYRQACGYIPGPPYPSGKILQWLLRTKIPEWPPLMQWLHKTCTRSPYHRDPSLRMLLEKILCRVDGDRLFHIPDMEPLQDIRRWIQAYLAADRDHAPTEPAGVSLRRAIHTAIRSRGAVTLQEAQFCDIVSDEWVDIRGHVVGGHIGSQKHVQAHTLGTEEGVDTQVSVVHQDGWIRSQVIYPGTVMWVGDYSQRITLILTDVIMDNP
jgi:hypothetical protein